VAVHILKINSDNAVFIDKNNMVLKKVNLLLCSQCQ